MNNRQNSDYYSFENILDRELARRDYLEYVNYVHHGKYKIAAHNIVICNALDKVQQGEITRLMVFLPPRHSKSMSISETFGSYCIGKNPDCNIIEVSYGDTLAKRFGRLNKNKVEEFGKDLFEITLSRANKSNVLWGIEGHRGQMLSGGYGSAITGAGADILIIDDPIKNRQEAISITYQEHLFAEWQNTLLTRLHPGGRVVIVLTRWHQLDLAGRILADEGIKNEGGKWDVISIPCECEGTDPKELDDAFKLLDGKPRQIGDPLWPEHGFDKKWMEDQKKSVGAQAWNSLYQQHPTAQEGTIFKRVWLNNFYKVLPANLDEIIQSWDMTFKDASTSDFVVGQIWGRKGAMYYLIDQVRARMDFVATMAAVKTLSAKHPKAYLKLVEDKANGAGIMSMLKKTVSGLVPVEPLGSKEARAYAVTPSFESGNVVLPDPSIAPWIHDYIEELVGFPTAANDDCVDSTSQAIARFNMHMSIGPVTKPKGW